MKTQRSSVAPAPANTGTSPRPTPEAEGALVRTGPRNAEPALTISRLERLAPALLVVALVLWIALVFAASFYKYETYGQGYDQVDFEQAIWNTVQGRPMEDSRFNFSDSIFGMDWMPMLVLFVPFYALVQSPHTLIFLHIVGAALGAIPLYWLARERLQSKVAGLAAGLVYLLYPTLLYGVTNPFQVRLFATSLLLFAFWYFEKANWKLFTACVLLAVLARTDVSLVVAMFGVYALLTRKAWRWVALPLAGGLAYFAVSTFVLVPSFLHPDALRGPSGAVPDYMACWPCGHNPVLAYYGHLGSNFSEIIKYIVAHPVDVAKLMFTGPKLEYLLSLILPLAFLPLLAPKPLVLGLPILVLNLLSLRSSQFSYQYHYSLLIIPGLFAAAIYGAGRLSRALVQRRETVGRFTVPRLAAVVMVALVVWAVLMNVPYKNPVARAFLFHESPARVAAANELVAIVPADAKVAASSKLAPHLLPRRYIYNFPPAPYSPYNFGPNRQSARFVDLDYILVDPANSALDVNLIGDQTALDYLKVLPEWHMVANKAGLLLYKSVP